MDRPAPLILLIEDEPQMRRFLRTALGANDYRLVEAETAKEGLAQAASRNPDVILLDLGLPDRDGLEVARELREWSATPIIVTRKPSCNTKPSISRRLAPNAMRMAISLVRRLTVYDITPKIPTAESTIARAEKIQSSVIGKRMAP